MDTLPLEITSHILYFCELLPLLQLVCRQWRDIINTHFAGGMRDYNNKKSIEYAGLVGSIRTSNTKCVS